MAEMTRVEAAKILYQEKSSAGWMRWVGFPIDIKKEQEYKRFILAVNVALDALRGPQPDPETGLVRCGCGGKAEIRKWEWANDAYIAGCTVCDANVDFPYDIDETDKIISDWNRAMGRRTEK